MVTPDYYEVLQLHPLAEAEVIQAAYRRLAMKYHPDVSPGAQAQQRMVLLNAAYDVLKDPQKRRAYDRQRAGSARMSSAQPPAHSTDVEVVPAQVDFGAVAHGQSRAVKIRVVNLGPGRLSGTVHSLVPWAKATPPEFSGNNAEITLRFLPVTPGIFRSASAVEVVTATGRVLVGASGSCVLAGQPPSDPTDTSRARGDPIAAWSAARPVAKRTVVSSIPFTTALALGAVITGAIWFAISPPLAILPAALALYMLWRRYIRGTRAQAETPQKARRGPTGLGRCAACGSKFELALTAKCSRCGGTICGSCGVCPCGLAQR